MGDIASYASALGFKPKAPPRADPPAGAGIVPPDELMQDTRFADGSASGPGGSRAALQREIAIAPNNEARAVLSSELAKMEPPKASDLSPYAAALGFAPAAPPSGPSTVGPQPSQVNIPVPMDRRAPTSAPKAPGLLERAGALAQAGANTVAGAVGGGAGALYGALEGVGENVGSLIGGQKPTMSVEKQSNLRARQFTPTLPKALQTELGNDYTEISGKFIAENAPAIAGLMGSFGASRGAVPTAARAVGDSAKSTLDAAFAQKKAPGVRVEPTMAAEAPVAAKPRYRIVNGEIQQVEAPAATSATAAQAAAPKPTYTPSIKDTSPEFQQAIAQAKGPLNPDVVSRHIEAETLPVPMRLTKGQATQDPGILSNEVNSRGKSQELANAYNQQGKQLVQNVDAIRDAAAPEVKGVNHVENGQSLIDSYKTLDKAKRSEISANYKALSDANGGELPLSGNDFVSAADAALKKQMKGRYVPSQIAADLEDFRGGGAMTFENFENLRTNLAAEARKAERAGDGNAAAAVNIVRNALEDLPMTGETAAIKPLADAARKSAKARFDAIKADPAYKAAVNDPSPIGEMSAAADNFVNNFVVKGKAANVARMREGLAADPVAQQTMAAGVINYLKKQAGADPVTGNFSQAGYNRALAEIAPKLDQLFDPKTAQQIQAVGNVAKYTQAQPRGSYVNNSNTFVSMAADKAMTAAEKAGNMVVPGAGLGTDVRSALRRRAERKGVEDSLRPGAGVTRLSDFPK